MIENEESQIVRYVNTFTVADWQVRRPNEKMRKGITRVTKSNSQSADKFAQLLKQRRAEHELVNDQNQNFSNRNRIENTDPTSPAYLLERIKNLELQLTVLEKEKIELEKRVSNESLQRKPMMGNFVESHYIACKEDVEDLLSEKARMQEAINNLEGQNSILKLNIGFQEQYIMKVQAELDFLRAQPQSFAKPEAFEQFIQTDYYCQQVLPQKTGPQLAESSTQCQNWELNQYEQLNKLARKFQQQTSEFSALIQNLEKENLMLSQDNHRLNSQLQEICALCKESQQINQNQANEWNERMMKVEKECEAKIEALSNQRQQEIRSKIKYYEEMVSQKNAEIQQLAKKGMKTPKISKQQAQIKQDIQQLQRNCQQSLNELRQAQQRERLAQESLMKTENELIDIKNKYNELRIIQELLRSQQIKNSHLQHQIMNLRRQIQQINQQKFHKDSTQDTEQANLKKQFDSLLLYLEQKNEQLKQKQLRIGQQMQNEQLIYMKNEETLRKQTEIEAIIAHYQNQIRRIQGSLESYISELLVHKSEEKQNELKEVLARQELEQTNNHQQKLYLLSKIDSLQKELAIVKTENKQVSMTYFSQSAKIQQKQCIISKLRTDLMELSKKYELQVSLRSKYTQQSYQMSQRLAKEESVKSQILLQLQKIKDHYDSRILSMQQNINHLQSSLQAMQSENMHAKQTFQIRLVEVKKDYDVLYSKYMKYKTLSIHLQGPKPKKY